MFQEKDLKLFKQKGIELKKIKKQIDTFKKGFPFLPIVKPAVVGEGMIRIDESEVEKYIKYFNEKSQKTKMIKFVPASGAATRMFKKLFEFVTHFNDQEINSLNELKESKPEIYIFFNKIKSFAFYYQLNQKLKEIFGKNSDQLIEEAKFIEIINTLLNQEGLNYGNLPKGLLDFHNYGENSRTPIEEHLVEGANYCKNDNKINIHFTVSPEHKNAFKTKVNDIIPKLEAEYNAKFKVDYSIQKQSTDTIAVDMNNEPFRESNGTILFRPGGHGALINNLNDLKEDLIFVKNIDNIVPDRLKTETYKYKKALAGILLTIKDQIFDYIHALKSENYNKIDEIIEFYIKKLSTQFPDDFYTLEEKEKADYLFNKLRRPIRVCGMVKNEGEPGGGPFWAKNNDNTISLQIVESSQINLNNPKNSKIVSEATHFNPVDLICYIKDEKGEKYNLLNFTDPKTGFISEKSKDGRDLKALELPGLWNGAMSDWNTIFVEVPLITFNPVKTIFDLLRNEHQ